MSKIFILCSADGNSLIIGNQVQILDDPVTVNGECPEEYHWACTSARRRLDMSEKVRKAR